LLNKETKNLVRILNRYRRTFIASDALNSDLNREAQDKEHEWVLKHLHLNPNPKSVSKRFLKARNEILKANERYERWKQWT
jgi:hypothetical protein